MNKRLRIWRWAVLSTSCGMLGDHLILLSLILSMEIQIPVQCFLEASGFQYKETSVIFKA